ncbi:MAG: lysoplasmalogenase [Parvularculaceae bacterium]|nr:lysoplasmalogenase [Parvularculaceae bacterium]
MNPALFLLLCAAAVAGLLYAEHTGDMAAKRIFKPLASLAFILAALAAGALGTTFGQIILAGLILCALGDVLLIPKSPSAFFLAGMGAFAAGHGAYIAAFAHGGLSLGTAAAVGLAGSGALSIALLTALWKTLGAFRLPVIIYCVIISVMVAASFGHWSAEPGAQSLRLALAAAGFALSDVSVARDRFGRESFLNRLWGLPLYYGAQCLFAVSV